MKKLFNSFIVVGLAIAVFFFYQWWNGTQSTEHIPSEDMVAAEEVDTSPVEGKTSVVNDISESIQTHVNKSEPVTNDQLDLYDPGDTVGRLYIPRLETAYETYWGTDDRTLSQGVGIYVSQWTTNPDEGGHTVLSGHRDTVFSELGDLEDGDRMLIEYQGMKYEYEINKIWITDADDLTVIVKKDEPTLTLTTCYPFQYLGDAPDRYIIESKLVHSEAI
ncbi:class D sortase [Shouchella sp. 1P09AA]|uniref:class D sortase n=1 Tax=unclassified Shouchella TaxID=2893065 RepID=UPI0039A047B3